MMVSHAIVCWCTQTQMHCCTRSTYTLAYVVIIITCLFRCLIDLFVVAVLNKNWKLLKQTETSRSTYIHYHRMCISDVNFSFHSPLIVWFSSSLFACSFCMTFSMPFDQYTKIRIAVIYSTWYLPRQSDRNLNKIKNK